MRVALVGEGTYPFAMGGVSTWCDQLIRGMPDLEWEVVALMTGRPPAPLWPAPQNLAQVRPIEVWSPRPRPPAGAERGVADGYAAFTQVLVRPMALDAATAARDHLEFADALYRLLVWSNTHRAAPSFAHDDAVNVLLRSWRRQRGTQLQLGDAIRWSTMCEHLLRPLFERPIDVDVVHASMNGPSMLVAMAAKWWHGTPVVMSEHGVYLRERYLLDEVSDQSANARILRLGFFRLLAGAGYLIADAVAPHSRYNRRWQLRNGAALERMTTMYNGVQPTDFPIAAVEPTQPTVTFLGRIDPIKDIHTLLRAFALVVAALPEARLRIFGGSPVGQEGYLRSCRALIDELGLGGAVTMEGPTSDPVTAYHGGSIVALSSISEGFPYTVVEAMACGRPVVCTNVGGVAEAVGDGGLVVPPRDPDAMAAAFLRLLLDDDERARRAVIARERVIEWFTVERWVTAYRSLYDSVAA